LIRKAVIWIALALVGAILGGAIGWFIGDRVGIVATRGCKEMECLGLLLWSIGGAIVGGIIGVGVGALVALRFRPLRDSGPHPEPYERQP
jgi:membrane protein YqaA with SNARE-associated domain